MGMHHMQGSNISLSTWRRNRGEVYAMSEQGFEDVTHAAKDAIGANS
jgi:hypothetical protein